MAYENTMKVCDVIETKLNSMQMKLTNRFDALTEKVNNLDSHREQEPDTYCYGSRRHTAIWTSDSKQAGNCSINDSSDYISEEKEWEKQKLNLIVHNLHQQKPQYSEEWRYSECYILD